MHYLVSVKAKAEGKEQGVKERLPLVDCNKWLTDSLAYKAETGKCTNNNQDPTHMIYSDRREHSRQLGPKWLVSLYR